MKYDDYFVLPWYKKILKKLIHSIKNIIINIVSFFTSIGRGVVSGIKGFGRGIKNFFRVFAKGDILTKLSYFIMGSGCLFRGQIVRGLIFMALQVFYIVYMISFGLGQLMLFPSLGIYKKRNMG